MSGTQPSTSSLVVAEEPSLVRDGTAAVPEHCLNCDSPLLGEYCANCGQHSKHHVHSTSALFSELIEDLFHTDHRVWRTIKPLVLKPGKLTAEYLRGKRVTYTPPFRLYIVLSLLFFLSASLNHDVEVKSALNIGDAQEAADRFTATVGKSESGEAVKTYEIDEEAADQLDDFLDRIEDKNSRKLTRANVERSLHRIPAAEQKQIVAEMLNPCSATAIGSALPEGMKGREQLLKTCEKAAKNNGKGVVEGMKEHAPHAMFFFLPLIALVTKVLYLGSRRYYAEHVLFFVHFHAFAFLALTFDNVCTWLLDKFPHTGFVAGSITAAVYIYLPFYLFHALRTVFGGGRFVTSIRFAFLLGGYLTTAFLTFMFVAAYTAITLK